MKRFTFKKIDAFATELSSGNPAGAVYLVRIEARHEPGRKPRVLFGGSAMVRIEGEYILA